MPQPMTSDDARRVVLAPYNPVPKAGVGFYEPSPEFLAAKEHIAVMDEDTGGLLAITGMVGENDETNIKSLCEAVVYAGAFELFDLAKRAAAGEPVQVLAGEILESLRHKMDGLQLKGDPSAGLHACILGKLGLARVECPSAR